MISLNWQILLTKINQIFKLAARSNYVWIWLFFFLFFFAVQKDSCNVHHDNECDTDHKNNGLGQDNK